MNVKIFKIGPKLMFLRYFFYGTTLMSLINAHARLFFLGTLCHPARPYFEPARLSTFLPARLLKPAPFWILLLAVSKKEVKVHKLLSKCCSTPGVATQDKF